MKLQNVLRIMSILFIAFFVCVSIGLSMDITPTKTTPIIANSIISNENPVNEITDENDVETNSSLSKKENRNDLLNFNTSFIENEEFTPNLYRWLWEKI